MSDAIGIPSVEIAPKRRTALANFLSRLWKEKPLGTASGIIILILIFVAIFADVLAPYGFLEVHLADRLQGSSARYLLGTDQLGRDFFSRLIYGARLSIVVGLAATSLNVVVAALIGGTSGFLGGKFDLAVQRFVDAWMAFPGLLLRRRARNAADQVNQRRTVDGRDLAGQREVAPGHRRPSGRSVRYLSSHD